MSESLNQLVKSAAFLILHENIERWASLYEKNTCDENVTMGCEIIELNARIQNQLFRLLSICASEGGLYEGASAIKFRLLPLLGSSSSLTGLPLTTLSSFKKLDDANTSKPINGKILDDKSSFTKENGNDKYRLRNQISTLEEENERLRSQLVYPVNPDNDTMKYGSDGIKTILNTSKPYGTSDVGHLSLSASQDMSPSVLTGVSPLSSNDPIQRYRKQVLVMRFNELFSSHRIEAMSILRRYNDNYEMNQKIIFYAVVESFSISKSHFRSYRNRIRTQIASNVNLLTNENLDELVQSHINVHASHSIEFTTLVKEVCLALERRVPRLRRPSHTVGFEVIKELIHETCKLAWECAALAQPLEICRPVCENELIDETKYRRSHDSSYPTLLIHHHIWPCLVQGDRVIVKGEVCTRSSPSNNYGYDVSPMDNGNPTHQSRTRINSRSCSPMRRPLSPDRE